MAYKNKNIKILSPFKKLITSQLCLEIPIYKINLAIYLLPNDMYEYTNKLQSRNY